MAKSNMRKALATRNGERFRVTGTVERFGHKNGWAGDVHTVLLKDRIAFTARTSGYEKG
jgi:hypothetical protein